MLAAVQLDRGTDKCQKQLHVVAKEILNLEMFTDPAQHPAAPWRDVEGE